MTNNEQEVIKNIIIASFIPKTNLDWFIKYVNEKFKINEKNLFIYEIEDNELDYLLTFKLKKDKKIDLKQHFNNATIVNIKNECIFSINGLNKLIEMESNCEAGNINYKDYKVNWLEYKNKLILCNKKALIIKNIKKVEKNSNKSEI
jgi:hypothetical protein